MNIELPRGFRETFLPRGFHTLPRAAKRTNSPCCDATKTTEDSYTRELMLHLWIYSNIYNYIYIYIRTYIHSALYNMFVLARSVEPVQLCCSFCSCCYSTGLSGHLQVQSLVLSKSIQVISQCIQQDSPSMFSSTFSGAASAWDYLQAEICHKICAALCCFEPGGRPFRRHPQSQMSRALGFIDCIRIYPGLCYFFAQRLKLGIRRNMCHTRQKSSCMTLIQHLQP